MNEFQPWNKRKRNHQIVQQYLAIDFILNYSGHMNGIKKRNSLIIAHCIVIQIYEIDYGLMDGWGR